MNKIVRSQAAVTRSTGWSRIRLRQFLTQYLLYMVVATLMMAEPITQWVDLNSGFSNLTARASAKLLSLFGMTCAREGTVLSHAGSTFEVSFGCNGLEAAFLYCAAILAFPASWKRKSIGLLAGFPALQLSNIVRIALLVYCGVYFKGFFQLLHVYLAQGGVILITLIFFLVYIRFDAGQRNSNARPASN